MKVRLPMVVVIGVAVLSLAAVACSSSSNTPTPAATSTPSVAHGQQLFTQDCVACHKADASGGVQVGDATSADIRWSSLSAPYNNNVDLVKRAILTGLDEDGDDLDSAMPKWQGQLSDSDVSDIVAYLQTLQ